MKYQMKYISEHKLNKLGFNKVGDGIYRYRFPLYKWNKVTTLWGEITLNTETKDITTDVKTPGGEAYPPYYGCGYGNYDTMMNIIKSGFYRKFKEFGIEEKKNNVKKNRRKPNNNK